MTTEFNQTQYSEIWTHIETLPWVALATTGRSGTDFFQSLLDGHPEIAVYNGTHFFYIFWDTAQTVNYGGPLIVEHILEEYVGTSIQKFLGRYDVTERKGELGDDGCGEITIDLTEFRKHVLGLLAGRKINARNFLIALVAAFDMSLGRDMLLKKVFLHHAHRISRTHRFLKDFPCSKVLCMVRDPRANFVSGVEHWRQFEPKTNNPAYPIYIIWRAVDEMAEFSTLEPERIAALRLEDLGDRDVLEAFCKWINIAYHPCMAESTWGGMRWWGDQISGRKTPEGDRGFSPAMISNRWQKRLLRSDQIVLNHVLNPMISAFGYPKGAGSSCLWLPLVAVAILLPSTYEWRFLKPDFLIGAIGRGQWRVFVRSFWHPLRRIRLYYSWLWRRHLGTYFAPQKIGNPADHRMDV